MSIAAAKTCCMVPPRQVRWLGLALCAAIAAIIAWLFGSLAAGLVQTWSQDDNYSHGPLVVLAALGLTVHALRGRPGGNRPAPTARDVALGLTMLLMALLLHGAAWLLDFTLLDLVSLVTLLLAVTLAVGGRSLRQDLGFPILLLLFAAPLPVAWYQPLALGLQKLVSASAATIFSVCGLSVYREGHVIHFSGMVIEVGAACSGMRQLTAYLALGAVIGHLARRGRGFTVALLALSAAMAVAANLLRILLTGVILLTLGAEAASGIFHTLEGLATLAIGAAGLLAAAVLLARWQDRHRTPHAQRDESSAGTKRGSLTQIADGDGTSLADDIGITRSVMGTRHAPRVSVVMGLVLALLVSAAAVQSAAIYTVAKHAPPVQMPLAAPLSQLPRQLGPWQGIDSPPPANVGWADQFVRRDYRHAQTGQVVVVWIVYSQSGADRAHHPEICMDVAGRVEDRRRRTALPLPGGPPIAEFVFSQPGDELHTWYWHYALPEVQPAETNLLAQAYHRARRRRASVTAEAIASDSSPAGQSAARDLVARIDAALKPLFPAGSQRGSQRLPVGVTAAHGTDGTDRKDGSGKTTGPIRRIRLLGPHVPSPITSS